MESLKRLINENLKLSKIRLLKLFLEYIDIPKSKPSNTMNNLKPKDTGLDNDIWIMPQVDQNDLQHSKNRIKVADQDNPKGNSKFPIIFNKSIDDTNTISKLKLNKNSKRKLKWWMKENIYLLKKYTNKEIDFKTFLDLMKKVK